jgi:hypothetical protein
MLSNIINDARNKLIRRLKNEKNTFGLMNVVLNSELDRNENKSFVPLHKSGIKTLFNLIRGERGFR